MRVIHSARETVKVREELTTREFEALKRVGMTSREDIVSVIGLIYSEYKRSGAVPDIGSNDLKEWIAKGHSAVAQ